MTEIPADRARALIFNCLIDKSNAAEKEELAVWANSDPSHRSLIEWLDDEEQIKRELARYRSIDPEKAYIQWLAGQKRPVIRMVYRVVAVACVLLLLAAGSWWFSRFLTGTKTATPVPAPVVAQDRMPGRNRAVLTLSDGRMIDLDSASNGPLSQEGNMQLVKKDSGSLAYITTGGETFSSGVFNTLTVPKAGQYQLDLPDGTRVWLNNASQLRYSISETDKNRIVELTGEAYFEVARNDARPFMVKTGEQFVEVLGTSFNVMAYPDEQSIKTTLISGKVQVRQRNNKIVLHPGEQAAVGNQGGGYAIAKVDTANVIAWKDGYFHFMHTDLGSVMRQLGRWYDMEVVMQRPAIGHVYNGKIKRNLSLLKILDDLQDKDVHFNIMDNRLIVSQ